MDRFTRLILCFLAIFAIGHSLEASPLPGDFITGFSFSSGTNSGTITPNNPSLGGGYYATIIGAPFEPPYLTPFLAHDSSYIITYRYWDISHISPAGWYYASDISISSVDYFVPSGTSSPRPTPTPSPSPLPSPAPLDPSTDSTLSGSAFSVGGDVLGGDVELWIDGQLFDSQYSSSGNYSFNLPEELRGKPYKIVVAGLQYKPIESTDEPLNIKTGNVVASGTTPTGSVSSGAGTSMPVAAFSQSFPTQHITTVDSAGNVQHGALTRNTFNAGGDVTTVYSYSSQGKTASLQFSGTGANAATADDIRRLQTQIAGDSQILSGKLGEIASNTSGTSAGDGEGNGWGAGEKTVYDNAAFSPSGIDAVEELGTVPTGSNISWVVTFPGGGPTVDFNPMQFTWFVALASWLKIILWWLLTIWITWYVYKRMQQLLVDCIHSITSAEMTRTRGYLVSIALGIFWKLALSAALLLFISLVFAQFGTSPGLTNWALGGKSSVASLLAVIMPGESSLNASVFFLGQFFPLDHALLCLSIWLGSEALAFIIHFVFSAFTRVLHN